MHYLIISTHNNCGISIKIPFYPALSDTFALKSFKKSTKYTNMSDDSGGESVLAAMSDGLQQIWPQRVW